MGLKKVEGGEEFGDIQGKVFAMLCLWKSQSVDAM